MSSVKHIVFISPGFPVNESDDICIPPFQAFIRSLKQLHPALNIEIIALHYPFTRQSYTWNGIKVHPRNGSKWGKIGKIALWFSINRLLRKIHARNAIDIIHTLWMNDTTFLAQWFCRRRGIPIVTTIMGQDALSSNRYLRFINYSSLKIIALSSNAADKFEANTGESISAIIPWGIDAELVKKQAISGVKEIDILAVASLIDIKNPWLFIEIIKELTDSGLDIKSVIYGRGGERSKIEQMIRRFDLEDYIELRGAQARSEVLQAMENSKLLLHTSHYEGQGYVFLEALAKGLPVVSRDVGFLPEDELVHICNSKEEMIDSIISIMENPGDSRPTIPVDIQDTVNEYWKIYNQETQESQ